MNRIINTTLTIGIILIAILSLSVLQTQQIEVIVPGQEREILYNVYTERVEFSSNFLSNIEITISEVNTDTGELIPVFENIEFQESRTFTFLESGIYLFEITSSELIELTITDVGFNPFLLFLGVFLVVLKVAYWIYNSNVLFLNQIKFS